MCWLVEFSFIFSIIKCLNVIGSTNGKDTCQGDSGGGLYSFDSNINRYVLVGLTSYGGSCGSGPG